MIGPNVSAVKTSNSGSSASASASASVSANVSANANANNTSPKITDIITDRRYLRDFDGTYHPLINDDDKVYGINTTGYPTEQRPIQFHRPIDQTADSDTLERWFRTSNITIGPAAKTPEEVQAAKKLLHTWRDQFSDDLGALPECRLARHYIPTYVGSIPHKATNPLYTAEEVEWMRVNLPKMCESGIITHSNSQWSSKPKFVRCKDNSLRMVHVFCKLNQATIKFNTFMKRIEPILHKLMQERYRCYWQADASVGYWGVPLAKEHAYKTAFNTPFGQFCYLRMGMGLSGAAHTYARMKDIFAGPIPAPNAEPGIAVQDEKSAFEFFMDDDYGAHATFQALHDFLHTKYFPRIAWSGLKLNPKKSLFWTTSLKLLGFAGSGEGGLRPSVDKIGAIVDYPIPTTVAEVERFLHISTYLKQWIPGRSEHSRIVKSSIVCQMNTRGQRRELELNWKEEHQQSFEHIKLSIAENVVWGGDPSLQYHLSTDASNHAIGAVLFQLVGYPAGTLAASKLRDAERIIMFISKPFAPAETRYHATEREALAVVRALAEVRWLVLGSPYPIKIYTDHQALLSVLKGDEAKGRLVRWQIQISEFDVEFHHVPGTQNVLADGMSRLKTRWNEVMCCESAAVEDAEGNEQANREARWEEWLEDEWYGLIIQYKLSGELPVSMILKRMHRIAPASEPELSKWRRRLKHQSARFILVDEGVSRGTLLYIERSAETAVCVRKAEVKPTLHWAHDIHGHFAEAITLKKLIGRYYWPTRHRDTSYYCRSCDSCQRVGPLKPSQDLLPIFQLQPMDMWGMDFLGPIAPISQSGNRYVLIVVDYFTRYLFAKPVPKADSAEVVKSLIELSRFVGWPRAIYHDNGSHFVSQEVQQLLASFGVKQYPAPKSHPQSVGLAERYVQLIVVGLRTLMATSEETRLIWDKVLPQVAHAINTRIIRTHGYTPSQLLFGYNVRKTRFDATPRDQIASAVLADTLKSAEAHLPDLETWVFNHRASKLEEIRDTVRERLVKRSPDKKKRLWEAPKEGDLVMMRRFEVDRQHGRKFEAKWEGPYRLAKISWHGKTGRVFDLKTGQEARIKKSGLHEKVHLDDLKVYVPREEKWLGHDNDLRGGEGPKEARFVCMCERLDEVIGEEGGIVNEDGEIYV